MIHIIDGQTDKILDYIPLGEFWNDRHYKSLKDTMETFDFTTFGDKEYAQHLAERNRIVIPDEDGRFTEFIIENTRKYRDSSGALFIEVYTVASYLELRKASVISPQTISSQTASTATGIALNGTEWHPGIIEGEGTRTFNIEEHTNPYAFIKRIANEFELENRFRVETDGNKVIGRYVDMLERVGEWQGREVEFGTDLIGIERKVDDSNVVTALLGLGPERPDGTRLEVRVEDADALQRWGRRNPQTGELMHLIETYEPQTTDVDMTLEQLQEFTANELEKRVNSVVEYSADVADLEKVPGMENKKIRFGDTIKIKDTEFYPPLYLEARVHTQERSLSDPSKKKVTLGDYIEYTEEEVMAIWKSLQAEIVKKVSMDDVTEVVYTKPEVDDKDTSVYQDSTYYADGVAETKKQEAIAAAATDATNKANTAEQNAKTHADTVADQARQDAINHANTVKTELEGDIAIKADADWVDGQLQLKENVIHRGTTAPTETNKLWLDTSTVPNVLKRFDGTNWVKATPTDAGEVGAYTKTEVDNALNSKVSVMQYTVDMNGVILELDNHESRITQNENEIITKVSETTYQQDKTVIEGNITSLDTRMGQAETSIQQNANAISLKADATSVYTKTEVDGAIDTIESRVTSAEIAIDGLESEILLKADASTVSSLETRVSSAEIAIDGLNSEIDLKVNKDGVIGAINISPETIKLDADRIEFAGHVFGENATFTGELQGATGTFSGVLTSGVVDANELIVGYENLGNWYDTSARIILKNVYRITDGVYEEGPPFTIEVGNNNATISVPRDLVIDGPVYSEEVVTDIVRLGDWASGGSIRHLSWDDPTRKAVGIYGYRASVADGGGVIQLYSPYDPTSFAGGIRMHENGSERVRILNGVVEFFGRVKNQDTYDVTTSNNANMYVATNGYYARSISAKKYKRYIELANVDYKKIMNLKLKSWYDAGELERNNGSTEGLTRYYGAIADDFVDIGLSEFVIYSEDGNVENYNDKAWILLIPNINDLNERVAWIETENSYLKQKLAYLEGKIA